MPRQTGRHCALVLLVLACIVGCSGSGPSASPSPAGGSTTAPAGPSRVKSYHNIAELKADSDAIVRVQATDRTQTTVISGIPFTITDVHVTEVIRGTLPSTIRIRQTDTGGVGGDDILKPGSSYLLFLERFARDGEDVTNQYAVVGVAAGLYLEDSGQASHQDTESPQLPQVLPVRDLKAQING
ncbi:hypothetical protein FF36_02666 [Frankia torreyi]|uniref:Lipoprotein n=1 Tax=Frankia torreyi TaxID=1856 RepID=A0A0D8BGG0_9ACTN|nr:MULTISPECIES: hypothetical protein [Frankia]KJE23064.1 hypothetical protein FF36_02666 [Frankia torreyi]KQC35941.1 hypothetical protein UK82_23945 [Frankia sp. ACN1ag]KQM05227.1 hypothetical protein FF86_101868 [Frankia sp. CpI1-P]